MRMGTGFLVLAVALVASGSYVAGTFHKSSAQALAATAKTSQASNVSITVRKSEPLSQWQREQQSTPQPQVAGTAPPAVGVQAGISPDQLMSLLQQLATGAAQYPANDEGHGKGHAKHKGHGSAADGQDSAQPDGND